MSLLILYQLKMSKLILIKYNKNKMGFFKKIGHSFHSLEHKVEKGIKKGEKKVVKFVTHHPWQTAIGVAALIGGAALIVGTGGLATPFVAEAEAATFAGISGAVSIEAASEMAFIGVAEASEMGVIGAEVSAEVGVESAIEMTEIGAEVGAESAEVGAEVGAETTELTEEQELQQMIDNVKPEDPMPTIEEEAELEQMGNEIEAAEKPEIIEDIVDEPEYSPEEVEDWANEEFGNDPDSLIEKSVQINPAEIEEVSQSVFQSVKEKIINTVRANLPTSREQFIEEVKNIIRQNVKLPTRQTVFKWVLGTAFVKSYLKKLEKAVGISTDAIDKEDKHIKENQDKINKITDEMDKLKETYDNENQEELEKLEKLLEETKQFQQEIDGDKLREQHLEQKNTQLQEQLEKEEQQIGNIKNEVENMKELIGESFLRPLDFSEMKLLMGELESDEIIPFLARNKNDYDKLTEKEKKEIINIGKKKMNI